MKFKKSSSVPLDLSILWLLELFSIGILAIIQSLAELVNMRPVTAAFPSWDGICGPFLTKLHQPETSM
jgi:hypothetical protein